MGTTGTPAGPAQTPSRLRRLTEILGPLRRVADRLQTSKTLRRPVVAWIGLLSGVGLFTVFLGWVWSLRYWSFHTNAWDMGAYFQAMYTTLFDHRLFYYTNDLPAGTHGYLFAAHFSPFLFLLLPAFALAPTPSGLLVLQALGLALGAIPVYFLARMYLHSGLWAALFAAVYLLSPLTMGTGWFDFHPEAFLPVTALTTFYLYERRWFYPFLAAWLLTLSVIETAAPLLLTFAVVGLVSAIWERRKTPPDEFRTNLQFLISAAALALVWYAVSAAVVLSLSPAGGTFGAAYRESWSILGATSIPDVFLRAVLAPGAAGAAVMYQASTKGLYLIILFGSFVFLPFAGRFKYLLPALLWIALAVLSNNYSYFVINDQYVAYVLPFLVAAAITGLARLREADFRWPALGRHLPSIGAALVIGLVCVSATSSPFLPTPAISFGPVSHGIPIVTEHDELLHEVIGLIPPGASVLTTSLMFPEVANRPDAYVSPVSSLFLHPLTFESVVGQYVNESQYVLVDYLVDYEGAVILTGAANLTGFGLEAAAQGAYLYDRGWTGPPRLWVPYTFATAGGNLTPEIASVDRSVTTPWGPTLYHPPTDQPGTVWQGPALNAIAPGSYQVTADVQLNVSSPGAEAAFSIYDAPIAVQVNVYRAGTIGNDYSFHVHFFPISGVSNVILNQTYVWNGTGPREVTFNWTEVVTWTGPGFLLTRGFALAPGVGIRLYTLTVTQVASD